MSNSLRTNMPTTAFILMPMVFALSLSACTTEQVYSSAQGWQRNQCSKLPDKVEFDRCMSNAGTAYGSYKRENEAGQK